MAVWPRSSSTDEITTGAQNDIKQATELARNMVGVWGMSDVIGPVTVITDEGQLPLPGAQRHLAADAAAGRRGGPPPDRAAPTSRSPQLMSANRDQLDALAQALLEHETLEQDEAYAAAEVEAPRETPLLN